MTFGIRHSPRRLALSIGAALGAVAFWVSKREKARACDNIRNSLGVNNPHAVKRLARKTFENLGKNVVEFVQFPHMSPTMLRQYVVFEGKEHIERALTAGKGAIMLTGHFGNWELLAASIVANGYTLHPIVRRLRSSRLESVVRSYRQKAGYIGIDREKSLRRALLCLKRNELLGILADVDTKVNGVFVEFFGRPAYTPYSPVAIALKTGSPILPTFIIRQPDDSHRVVVEPPMALERSGERHRDMIVNTQKFTRIIESYIQRYPSQWVWMHDRWKTQPCDDCEM